MTVERGGKLTARMSPRAPCALAALALAAACTRNPYVIGSICPSTGGVADPRCAVSAPGTLAVDLDQSGATAEALGVLALASGAVAPALQLRGERATATAWVADDGSMLARATGVPVPGLAAPFTDGTGAVGLPAAAPAYVATDVATGAVAADDFALEVVLRASTGATLLDKRGTGAGWALRTSAAGQLDLELADGDAAHGATISSTPLIAGAWYHCLLWVSRAAGGRVDCDGSPGALTPLPALESLAGTAALAAGGGGASDLAYVALFRAATGAGGLGPADGWLAVSQTRFAALTGVYPRVALGTAVPAAGLRASAAYVDLQSGAGARRLFLVGPDWPRIAARADAHGTLVRGYLSEPTRTRFVPADGSAWQPAGVVVSASSTLFADGEPLFAALAPSTASAPHALSFTATAGGTVQVFSFFAHQITAARVGASAGALGTAVFDLGAGRVVSAPAGVTATLEPWGDGIVRCSYAFKTVAGPTVYAVRLLDDAGNEMFAGSGAPAVEVTGLQVDVELAFPGSLLGADTMQPADHLTFVADDGNLPTGTSAVVDMSVLLPATTNLTDQAILNLNRDGTFADQVQLNVVGATTVDDAGRVKFWGISGTATHWTFDGDEPLSDPLPADGSSSSGPVHTLQAAWDATTARLVIDDGPPVEMPALLPNSQPFGLNRIDVGFSQSSSGALEGLVSRLQIGAM
jgi:hypothetical protein